MASLLAIDWDQRQLHLVVAKTHRKGVQVEKSVSWDMGEDLTPRSAEAVGRRLRDFLKSANVAATQVVFGIGRDRVILKEIRFPPVPTADEPALVRFQASKDLGDSPDANVIDYTHRAVPSGGDRQVLAVVARREPVLAVQALCRAAGLKLLALAPRPFGMPYTLERALQATQEALPAGSIQAVLTVTPAWAELCLCRGHEILLSRSLANGPMLPSEVKRTLAVFAAQHAADSGDIRPRRLYVFGNGQAPVQALQESLQEQVELVNPLTIADATAAREAEQGAIAGPVGLLHRWAVERGLPVNLTAPKKVQAAARPTRTRVMAYGVAALIVFAGSAVAMNMHLSSKKAVVARLTKEKKKLEETLKQHTQDQLDITALADWNHGTVPWLDELYDITARFPNTVGFRINSLTAEPSIKKGSETYVARMRISGVGPKEQGSLVHRLVEMMNQDKHMRASVLDLKDLNATTQTFTLKVEVTGQPTRDHRLVLIPPPRRVDPKMAEEPDAGEGD